MPGQDVVGVILAGGLARRMGGGDKGLKAIGGRPILGRVIAIAKSQTRALALNANGDPDRFKSFGLPVIPDSVPDFAGPLAGILAGLDWAADLDRPAQWVVSLPCDCPFLPGDLVARMWAAVERGAEMVCAASGGQAHPVIALWPVALRRDLRKAMTTEAMRKIDRWTARYRLAQVDWPTTPRDPFFNANSPEDLAMAETLLSGADKLAG